VASEYTCPLCGKFRLGPVLPVAGRLLCYECALVYKQARGLHRLRLWLLTVLRGRPILRRSECD
jgi:hypothetical protein